jgi:hypothetical protein
LTACFDLYLDVRREGADVTTNGTHLEVRPKGRITPELRARLIENKPAMIAWLTAPPCPGWQAVPPDDLPTDPYTALSRQDAMLVVDYLVRQAGRPGRLAAWVMNRQGAYFDAGVREPQAQTELACRDAACWQLRRSEREVVETLLCLRES